MRRLIYGFILLSAPARFIVGSYTGGLPTPSVVPAFGSGRRRRSKAGSDLKRDIDHLKDVKNSEKDSLLAEDDAKSACFESYGFVQKPLFTERWLDFYHELRRIEFRWSLVPLAGGTLVLNIVEHEKDSEHILCSLKGLCTGCAPIADFFECCGCIVDGSSSRQSIKFTDLGNAEYILDVTSKTRLPLENNANIHLEEPILPSLAQYNCLGISVSVSIYETKTGVVTPLFHDISLQCFIHAFLTSIPVFLKRTDAGIRNVDFVSKEQMRHFRFAWCFLRREARMTAVAMGELDALLPP